MLDVFTQHGARQPKSWCHHWTAAAAETTTTTTTVLLVAPVLLVARVARVAQIIIIIIIIIIILIQRQLVRRRNMAWVTTRAPINVKTTLLDSVRQHCKFIYTKLKFGQNWDLSFVAETWQNQTRWGNNRTVAVVEEKKQRSVSEDISSFPGVVQWYEDYLLHE